MMHSNFLRSGWRNIKKHKGFSLLNAGGLTLGIASALLLLLYVSYHVGYNKQFKDLDQIFVVENNQTGNGVTHTFESTPREAAATIKAEVPGVLESVRTISYTAEGLITYKDKNIKKAGLYADPGFFSVFSHQFIRGNATNALSEPNTIVLTQQLATTIFGDEDPINKTILRNKNIPLRVTGVIADVPLNTSLRFDYVLPWIMFEEANEWAKTSGWGSNFAHTYVKLKNPDDVDRVNTILRPMIGKHNEGNTNELFLFPFSKIHLHSTFVDGKSAGGLIEQINLFVILAAVILLIAAVNFMNLSTARAGERAREVGIRKAIGSDRKSLMLQFITESVLLSFVSTLAAILLVLICLPWFNSLLNLHLVFPYDRISTWVFVVGIALLTGLLSGSYPAFYLSSFEPIKVLKGLFRGNQRGLPVRKVLVVVQFFFAVFLTTVTIGIYRQIHFMQDRPTGFETEQLIEIPVEGTLGKTSDVLINNLKTSGVITSGTLLSSSITQAGNNTWGISWPGKDPKLEILVDIFHTGYEFTGTAGVKLIAGREFSPDHPVDTAGKTAMVNETLAKMMNLKEPIGARIKWGDAEYTLIGVYKDFVLGSPFEKTPPMFTSLARGEGGVSLALRLANNGNTSRSIEQVTAALKEVNPDFPAEIKFVDQDFGSKFQSQKLFARVANLFGCLAVIISCIGLFGLAAYAAEQRIKEVGVRKVLGASVLGLTTLLSKDLLKLVAIAICLAVPVSVIVLNKWLADYQFRMDLNWAIFAAGAVLTAFVALVTVSLQAFRAARANPVKSLRSE
ncbi:MAG: ABC transporter permease [Chitinophagaceae bacterium]